MRTPRLTPAQRRKAQRVEKTLGAYNGQTPLDLIKGNIRIVMRPTKHMLQVVTEAISQGNYAPTRMSTLVDGLFKGLQGETLLTRVTASVDAKFAALPVTTYSAPLIKQSAGEVSDLIRSIPRNYLRRVRECLTEHPADTRVLTKVLAELSTRTQAQVRQSVKDITHKHYVALSLNKVEKSGATHGYWIHSHSGKSPRKLHVAAHGERFLLSKGLPVGDHGGNYVQPGEEYGCMCTFKVDLDSIGDV